MLPTFVSFLEWLTHKIVGQDFTQKTSSSSLLGDQLVYSYNHGIIIYREAGGSRGCRYPKLLIQGWSIGSRTTNTKSDLIV